VFYYIFHWLKVLALCLDFLLITIILFLLSFLPKSSIQNFYPKLFRIWCKSYVRALGVDLKLIQHNQLPIPERYILIANHPSAFEDVGVPALFDVYSLAKIEVSSWPILGRISDAAGTLYVKRESKESRNAAAVEIRDALESGKNIAMYPEGGCFGKRIFETFRFGAFDISMQSNIPILPVFIHYESQEDFEWRNPHTLLDKMWHFLSTNNNRANYYVFDAINPNDFNTKEEYMEFTHGLYLKWQAKYLD